MKGHQVVGFWQVRTYYIGDRWYEKNKKKWAKDRALGHTCGYCCARWWWRVNFNKGCAICKIEANPGDDKAGQTKSMLKSVEKCGRGEAITIFLQTFVKISVFCTFYCRLTTWAIFLPCMEFLFVIPKYCLERKFTFSVCEKNVPLACMNPSWNFQRR